MKRLTTVRVASLVAIVAGVTALGVRVGLPDGPLARWRAGSFANRVEVYPVRAGAALRCTVDEAQVIGTVDRRLFGTNLEWFNEAGGLGSPDARLRDGIARLAAEEGVTIMRWPGGTLADFYHWRDGVGPGAGRPVRHHPTDPGSSSNAFGTPEFLDLLARTHAEGLITVNAGTGSADEAAAWVSYTNRPDDQARIADGHARPANIRDWEIGNELYLPGNPGEQIITVTPQEYARRYRAFARAMKAVDPTIRTMAIGVARSHVGPGTAYPDWTRVVLDGASADIDLVAVHNAYFPLLDGRGDESIGVVYPALWASPEAVDRSLTTLERLLDHYPHPVPIGIAVTEWGALFSLPERDRAWFDHVKTLGSGIYVARMLQVFLSHSRVEVANYFKLTDRSFMGWIDYQGRPKVPYRVFQLYAKATGDTRVAADVDGPTFDTRPVGAIAAERGVSEVTVVATRDTRSDTLYVNLLNRSMTTAYPIALDLKQSGRAARGTLMTIGAREPTAHNGRDIPPEWPYDASMEPYTSQPGAPIGIVERSWDTTRPIVLAPFSVATLVIGKQ